jgi:hypothetical protein
MSEMSESLKDRVEIGLGEIIVIALILVDILEFAGFLPYSLNYMDNVLEWAGLCYLLYKADLTEIFFGYKDKLIDILLILAYFLMIMKDFVVFSKTSIESVTTVSYSFLVPFYTFVVDNAYELQMWTFCAGAVMLILIAALNLFLNFEVKKPSIMAMMHEEGKPADFKDRLKRTVTSFMIFVFFFIFVFNLIMEWIAWAIDSSILIIAIFVYLFIFVKVYKKFNATNFIYKLGDGTSDFYTNFIKLFHEKSTIMIGVTGILVLHLITDGGIFIMPYILGKEIQYFASLGAGHETIISLARASLGAVSGTLMKALVVIGYAFNSIAAVLLFVGPAFIWYELYDKKKVHIPKIVYFLFFSSVSYLLLNAVLGIKRLGLSDIAGVDIFTKSLSLDNLAMYTAIAFAIGVIAFAMRFNKNAKRAIKIIAFSGTGLLFCYYIIVYSIDIMRAYVNTIIAGAPSLILFYYIIFLFATFFFYFGGAVYFVYISLYKLHKREV